MGNPLGRAPTQVGTAPWPEEMPVMEGTSPDDMKRIIGAQYMNNGVLPNGGLTVEGTSSMKYKVNHGAAFMFDSVASGLGVLVPVDTVTVNTAPAPSTGTRTDTIYVDGDGVVRVHEGTNPPHGVVIAQFVVPAGVTSTSSAQRTIDRNYAIPVGASLGRLLHWDGSGITAWTETNPTQRFKGQFSLPTDRIVRIEQVATLTTPDAATSLPHYAAFTYRIDGDTWVKRAYFQADPTRQTRTVSMSLELPEGNHTLQVDTHIRSFNGSHDDIEKIYVTESWDSALEMSLWDAGVSR